MASSNQDSTTSTDESGASHNQRLLAAAREDNEEMLLDVLKHVGEFDINFQDGAMHGSTDVLEHILSHEDCDVDPVNRLQKATPLHLALTELSGELRQSVVESLIDAGADTSIKDKNGDTALDLVGAQELAIKAMIRKARAEANISRDDIAHDDSDDDDAGSSGSEE